MVVICAQGVQTEDISQQLLGELVQQRKSAQEEHLPLVVSATPSPTIHGFCFEGTLALELYDAISQCTGGVIALGDS